MEFLIVHSIGYILLAWNDPTIGIKWPKVDAELNISEKDKKWGRL